MDWNTTKNETVYLVLFNYTVSDNELVRGWHGASFWVPNVTHKQKD